jgi:hypothetical protein
MDTDRESQHVVERINDPALKDWFDVCNNSCDRPSCIPLLLFFWINFSLTLRYAHVFSHRVKPFPLGLPQKEKYHGQQAQEGIDC